MHDLPLYQAAKEAADGLGQLAGAYGALHDAKYPGAAKTARAMRVALDGRAPGNVPVLDLVTRVDRLAFYADQLVSEWLGEDFAPHGLWWWGEPNPHTVTSLSRTARRLPRCVDLAHADVLDIARETDRVLSAVARILGDQAGAELAGACPRCHEDALIRTYSPDRWLCASPGCAFELRKEVAA